MISDKEFLLLYDEYSSKPRIWTSGFNMRTRVLKSGSVTAAEQRVDMRSGCHAEKILPVGVRGTKNVWCLSSLLFSVTLPGVTKWPTEKLLQNSRKNKTNLCLESPDLKGSVILLYFHFSRDRENTANQKQFRFFFSENKFNSENRWPNDWRCAFLALFFLH